MTISHVEDSCANDSSLRLISVSTTPVFQKLGRPAQRHYNSDSAITGIANASLQDDQRPQTPQQKPLEKPGFFRGVKADLRDLAKAVPKNSEDYLCSHCETFPFDACLAADQAEKVWSSPLRRMIAHRKGCRLCSFFIRALSKPENDPFDHPQVRPYLKQDQVNMDTWLGKSTASALEVSWPFGSGKLLKHEKERAGGATNILGGISRNTAAVAKIITAVTVTKYPVQGVEHLMQINEGFQDHLPCYVDVYTNPLVAGLLDVTLHRYGRGPRANLTTLSKFRLKVQLDGLPSAHSNAIGSLSYTNLVDPTRISFSMAYKWLQHCEQHHGDKCSEQGWSFITESPSFLRVIDVGQNCLVEFPSSRIKECRYVALSYVWGNTERLELRQSNRDKLIVPNGLDSFSMVHVTKTVRDAMTLTEAIGERYLWVDALCIEQDNPKEKRELIDTMDRVYANAVLTIVAADGLDANAGLSGVYPGSREIQQLTQEISPGRRIIYPLMEPKSLEASTWNGRAWTLQERLLSRRLMIFLEGQVIWHCRKTVGLEDMVAEEAGRARQDFQWFSIKPQYLGVKARRGYVDGSIVKQRDGRTDIYRSGTFTEYAKLVKQYSTRDLKFASDILKALAGLLNILGACFRCRMNYGLPENLLDAAVLWRPLTPLIRRPSSEVDIPSWSWAGWKGRVRYDEPFEVEDENGFVKIVEEKLGPEHFRPLLRWYTFRNGKLEPLNGNALGVPLVVKEGDTLPLEWDQSPNDIEPGKLSISDLPARLIARLTEKHLVFETSCTTKLKFGTKISSEAPSDDPATQRFSVVDRNGHSEAGILEIDTLGPEAVDEDRHEFIVISEAQYLCYGPEQLREDEDDDAVYFWYNVMLVEWDNSRTTASRLGLGRISKEAWKLAQPQRKVIALC